MREPYLVAGLMLACAAPAAAQDCALCFAAPGASDAGRPLTIEISTGLAFSRLAKVGPNGGSAVIDAQTGNKATDSGLIDLGGSAIQGHGRITGTPGRTVRIDLPRRITMTSTDGSNAVLTDLATDLPAWPVLDATGSLDFSFGGRIEVQGNGGGNFRGRIPITVDYN